MNNGIWVYRSLFIYWIPWQDLPRSSKSQKPYLIDWANIDLFAIEVKVGLEGLLGSGIDHFYLHLSTIWQPKAKEYSGCVDAIVGFVLQVVSCEPVFILGQFVEELVPSLLALSSMLDNLRDSSFTTFSFSSL